jgi:hypothetical protein
MDGVHTMQQVQRHRFRKRAATCLGFGLWYARFGASQWQCFCEDIHGFKSAPLLLAEVSVAAEHLDRNDHLLTVALQASASRHGRVQENDIDGAFTRL